MSTSICKPNAHKWVPLLDEGGIPFSLCRMTCRKCGHIGNVKTVASTLAELTFRRKYGETFSLVIAELERSAGTRKD